MNCADALAEEKPYFETKGFLDENDYQTEKNKSFLSKIFKWNTLAFYLGFTKIVIKGANRAKNNKYTRQFWTNLSMEFVHLVEKSGGEINISGLENIKKVEGPVIFVGNHMSTLETIALPCMVLREKELAITLKKQLFDVPIFGKLITGFKTVVVSRESPIDDYKTIMKEGVKTLKEGYSVLIFPQSTRTTEFSPKDFNSIGVKLAKRAKVPIIPIALKTDFWQAGKIVKDFGRIDRTKKVFFNFGEAITVEGNGKEENQQIIDFIQKNLKEWS